VNLPVFGNDHVVSDGGVRGRARTRVRVPARPTSVPTVRRFVDETLAAWGRTDLVDDVGLSVTELATNSTLHSRSPHFDVELTEVADGVRVAVVDTGTRPARSIASRVTAMPAPEDVAAFDVEGMTGRGLFIVSALASRWGIDDLPGGTRVWAEFGPGDDHEHHAPEVTSDPDRMPAPAPDGIVVRLLGCPADLLLAHDDHLADLARDLRLFAAGHADPETAASADQIGEVVRLSALSWDAARLVARDAVRDGHDVVDIAVAVTDPADVPRKVEVLRRATTAADQMARDGRLMTLPASPEVAEWRAWVADELVEQATKARWPCSFSEFRSRR
jgi:anti-sigma regulatory factor (Ser/Thr protein kinase)